MKKEPIRWKHARPLARLLLPALWLLLLACEKKDPLPKATQEGKNTFGCKIDGRPWVPDGGTGFQARKPIWGGFFLIVTSSGYRKGIYVRTVSKDGQEINLYLDGYEEGEHLLNENTQVKPASLNPKNYGLYRGGGQLTSHQTDLRAVSLSLNLTQYQASFPVPSNLQQATLREAR